MVQPGLDPGAGAPPPDDDDVDDTDFDADRFEPDFDADRFERAGTPTDIDEPDDEPTDIGADVDDTDFDADRFEPDFDADRFERAGTPTAPEPDPEPEQEAEGVGDAIEDMFPEQGAPPQDPEQVEPDVEGEDAPTGVVDDLQDETVTDITAGDIFGIETNGEVEFRLTPDAQRQEVAQRTTDETGIEFGPGDFLFFGTDADDTELGLTPEARRRLAAANLDEQIEDSDITAADIEPDNGGFVLTEETQRDIAAERLGIEPDELEEEERLVVSPTPSPQHPGDITTEEVFVAPTDPIAETDFRTFAPVGVRTLEELEAIDPLSEERTAAADALSDELGHDVDPFDITFADGEAQLVERVEEDIIRAQFAEELGIDEEQILGVEEETVAPHGIPTGIDIGDLDQFTEDVFRPDLTIDAEAELIARDDPDIEAEDLAFDEERGVFVTEGEVDVQRDRGLAGRLFAGVAAGAALDPTVPSPEPERARAVGDELEQRAIDFERPRLEAGEELTRRMGEAPLVGDTATRVRRFQRDAEQRGPIATDAEIFDEATDLVRTIDETFDPFADFPEDERPLRGIEATPISPGAPARATRTAQGLRDVQRVAGEVAQRAPDARQLAAPAAALGTVAGIRHQMDEDEVPVPEEDLTRVEEISVPADGVVAREELRIPEEGVADVEIPIPEGDVRRQEVRVPDDPTAVEEITIDVGAIDTVDEPTIGPDIGPGIEDDLPTPTAPEIDPQPETVREEFVEREHPLEDITVHEPEITQQDVTEGISDALQDEAFIGDVATDPTPEAVVTPQVSPDAFEDVGIRDEALVRVDGLTGTGPMTEAVATSTAAPVSRPVTHDLGLDIGRPLDVARPAEFGHAFEHAHQFRMRTPGIPRIPEIELPDEAPSDDRRDRFDVFVRELEFDIGDPLDLDIDLP